MKVKFLIALGAICLVTGIACIVKVAVDRASSPADFTNLVVRNLSKEDKIKVYVTLQYPNQVYGMFGIKDTINWSKGYFYAEKGVAYESATDKELLGVVISFGGDNLPCQVSVPMGFKSGINIFECSVNTKFETFDISCEDGCNAVIRTTVSDTVNWSTGDGAFQKVFKMAENKCLLQDNLNVRGVFPYRCTDCVDKGSQVPENCFNLRDTCNTQRICQVARTGHKGGKLYIDYVSSACEILK
jgi:hypothetical protein